MNKPCCHIGLFGGLRVLAEDETRLIADEIGSATIPRLPHRVSALLAFLALRLGAPQPREIIAESLWAEQAPTLARNSLSATLSLLRRHLAALDALTPTPDGIFLINRDQIGLNPALAITDVAEFESLLDAAEQAQNGKGAASPHISALLIEKAVAKYRGILMPGYYEDWLVREQERLSERCADALRRLAHRWESAGDVEAAARAAQRAVDADPLAEDAQLLLIRLLSLSGRTPAALAAYARFETLLQKEFGIAPSESARRLLLQVRGGAALPPGSPPNPPLMGGRGASLNSPINGGGGAGLLPPLMGGGGGEPNAEPIGGVVPLDSPYYVVRPMDDRFFAAIRRRDSIVLVKGARQTGKTSLLARGLQQARESGMRVVLTDFDALGDDALRSADTLFQTLAVMLADQLELEDDPLTLWSAGRGPAMNLERFLQQKALKPFAEPLLWGLDHVDRLFTCAFGSEAFALFRSWHNRRALDPAGLWSRLTLALTYATEAHLFITDPNQSPFNVGTRLTLSDFEPEQIADLHARFHFPLGDQTTLERFFALVGGQPYLSLCGLDAMARAESETKGGAASLLSALERGVRNDDPLFGDHLRRMRHALLEDANLVGVIQQMLRGAPCPTLNDLYRLRTAGILSGDAPETARFRCRLYRDYLARELPGQ